MAGSVCRESARRCWSDSSKETSIVRWCPARFTTAGRRRRGADAGGSATMVAETSCFDRASDHLAGGQATLPAATARYGMRGAARSHHHPGAMSGIRSKEFGGRAQPAAAVRRQRQSTRVQLRSSCHASELNLGHLIHRAENYRGSFRGAGLELRTDAWGALRGGQGMPGDKLVCGQ